MTRVGREPQRIDLAPGHLVGGRYQLHREISRGGTSRVYEAEHVVTGRRVAVKLLLEGRVDPRSSERLLREARLTSLARHPGVVEVLDAGVCDDAGPYVVQELLLGRPLDGALLQRGKLSLAESLRVGLALLSALDASHRRGVLHRDVKPSNVFIGPEPESRVTLIDYGIAQGPDGSGRKLTVAGEVLGTPEYMAPEQLMAAPEVDARVDVYAMGALLFECISGEVPFAGSYGEVLLAVSTAAAPPSLGALAPAHVGDAITRALQRDPDARWSSARDFARALRGDPARATPRVEPGPVRRRHARAAYVTPLRILYADGYAVEGRTEDISESGLLVITERACRDGEEAAVRFALPLDEELVTCRAITRWTKTARGRAAVGLEFVAPPERVRHAIARYVEVMTQIESRRG